MLEFISFVFLYCVLFFCQISKRDITYQILVFLDIIFIFFYFERLVKCLIGKCSTFYLAFENRYQWRGTFSQYIKFFSISSAVFQFMKIKSLYIKSCSCRPIKMPKKWENTIIEYHLHLWQVPLFCWKDISSSFYLVIMLWYGNKKNYLQ